MTGFGPDFDVLIVIGFDHDTSGLGGSNENAASRIIHFHKITSVFGPDFDEVALVGKIGFKAPPLFHIDIQDHLINGDLFPIDCPLAHRLVLKIIDTVV
mgnify:CR=1 FL=1